MSRHWNFASEGNPASLHEAMVEAGQVGEAPRKTSSLPQIGSLRDLLIERSCCQGMSLACQVEVRNRDVRQLVNVGHKLRGSCGERE